MSMIFKMILTCLGFMILNHLLWVLSPAYLHWQDPQWWNISEWATWARLFYAICALILCPMFTVQIYLLTAGPEHIPLIDIKEPKSEL